MHHALSYSLQVIVFICDGAKANRKFSKSLGKESEMKHGVVYKAENRYCRGQPIYFMSDVPHLVKTTRNCWYSSKSGGTRCMWVSAQVVVQCCIFVKHTYCTIAYAEKWKAYTVGAPTLLV